MRIDERVAVANRAVPVLEVDGRVYAAPALPIVQADEWLERAAEVEEAERAVQRALAGQDRETVKKAKAAYQEALAECVFGYGDALLPRAELEGKTTWRQLAVAFQVLLEMNDPFVAEQARKLRLLESLPAGAVERAMSDIQGRSGSSASEKSSALTPG